ncbi:MAG: DUF2892 domain-containing protein [Desulfobacterales bacterium]|nr:DUF2892 domain-containing protein [Desulfobacterales bacterium]
MKTNMARWDRILRIIIGIILLFIGFSKGGLWWIGAVIGAIFVVTSFISYCPLYSAIGLSTKREQT